jgi:hypothetical protein
MSDLESLVSRAATLSGKVDFWNSMVLWALFITAIAAGAIVLCQRMATVRAKQLSGVQDEIVRIKDSNNLRLSGDLETQKGLVAKLQFDAAKQRERAANAERAFLELKRKTEPRRVSHEQATKFLSEFRLPKATPTSIYVFPIATAPDATDFAKDLVSLLHDAGFQVRTEFTGTVNHVSGVVDENIEIAAGTDETMTAEHLRDALIKADIVKPPVQIIKGQLPDTLILYIARRPTPH